MYIVCYYIHFTITLIASSSVGPASLSLALASNMQLLQERSPNYFYRPSIANQVITWLFQGTTFPPKDCQYYIRGALSPCYKQEQQWMALCVLEYLGLSLKETCFQ